jgi:O-antigen/teichoic acid export membrane protein
MGLDVSERAEVPVPVPPPTGESQSSGSLAAQVLRGSAWTTGGFVLRQLIRLGSNLILARLLFPEAFGLMAIVNAYRVGLEMVSDIGLAPNIVQSARGEDPSFLDTAWTLQILRGAALFLIACLLAWPVALFYEEPILAQMLPVASLGLLLSGFNSTALIGLRRRLQLGRLEIIELAAQLVSLAVMLGWVWVQPSVWALVWGGVAANVVVLVLSHVVAAERRDRFAWDAGAMAELIRFGKWIFLSTLLTFLGDQADRLMLGKLGSIALLGVYSIAAMFATLPVDLLGRVGAFAIFPALSRRYREGRGSAAVTYRRVRLPMLALAGLIVAVTVAIARPAITLLYDPRYGAAGYMLELLALSAWFRVLEIPTQAALLAVGEPRWLAFANGVKVFALLIGVPVGYYFDGFSGAIYGLIASNLIRYLAEAYAVTSHGMRSIGSDLLLTVLVVVAGFGGRKAGYQIEPAYFTRLVVAGLSAAALWAPVALLLLRGGALRHRFATVLRGS